MICSYDQLRSHDYPARGRVAFDEYTIFAPLSVHVNVKSQMIRDARYISSGDAFCSAEKQVGRLAGNCCRYENLNIFVVREELLIR